MWTFSQGFDTDRYQSAPLASYPGIPIPPEVGLAPTGVLRRRRRTFVWEFLIFVLETLAGRRQPLGFDDLEWGGVLIGGSAAGLDEMAPPLGAGHLGDKGLFDGAGRFGALAKGFVHGLVIGLTFPGHDTLP